jgi:hypothetical protein
VSAAAHPGTVPESKNDQPFLCGAQVRLTWNLAAFEISTGKSSNLKVVFLPAEMPGRTGTENQPRIRVGSVDTALGFHKTQMRCHSVFEDHSSCGFFQDRCVATESTVDFEPLLRARRCSGLKTSLQEPALLEMSE